MSEPYGSSHNELKLGDLQTSERLIEDLYIDLRKKVNFWSSITDQTSQARMGYVGQHLVSVVTGYRGGKSGARGKDLKMEDDQFSEIKTCYRVDQLGKCKSCGKTVLPIESSCPTCGSTNITRNEDSKWLIGIRDENEFRHILDPKFYYLVLFDFPQEEKADYSTIQSSIWRVDSKAPGFSLCMVDYYLNIRTKSKSKAPFNLWPYLIKFYLMRPVLIYKSLITSNNKINTLKFPGRDDESLEHLPAPEKYYRSTGLTDSVVRDLASVFNVQSNGNKLQILNKIYQSKTESGSSEEGFIDTFAMAFYKQLVEQHYRNLPVEILRGIPHFRDLSY